MLDPTRELTAVEMQTVGAAVDANVGVLAITEEGKMTGLWVLDALLAMLSMGARAVFGRPASVTHDAVAAVLLLAWRSVVDELPASAAPCAAPDDGVEHGTDARAPTTADATEIEMMDVESQPSAEHPLLEQTASHVRIGVRETMGAHVAVVRAVPVQPSASALLLPQQSPDCGAQEPAVEHVASAIAIEAVRAPAPGPPLVAHAVPAQRVRGSASSD